MKFVWMETPQEAGCRKFVCEVDGKWYYTAFLDEPSANLRDILQKAEKYINSIKEVAHDTRL